jgi:GTP cyclohydrolase FolE2
MTNPMIIHVYSFQEKAFIRHEKNSKFVNDHLRNIHNAICQALSEQTF